VCDDDIVHLFGNYSVFFLLNSFLFIFIGSTCSTEIVEVSDITAEFNLQNNQKLRLMEEHLHLIIRK